MPKRYPNPPPLSNRLADLAERIGEAARYYKRASVEAHNRYIEAGTLLAEARAARPDARPMPGGSRNAARRGAA